jgi:D-serine dehydratase
MQHPDTPGIFIYDVGIDNRTEADGLSVPVASELAVAQMRPLPSGVITTDDDTMFIDLYCLQQTQQIKVEPSAAAAVSGPRMLLQTPEGLAYINQQGLAENMHNANHIIWSTGGLFVPSAEYEGFLKRGRDLAAALP